MYDNTREDEIIQTQHCSHLSEMKMASFQTETEVIRRMTSAGATIRIQNNDRLQ